MVDAHHWPPGWYQDPFDTRSWRWWDGAGWTGHVAPAVALPTDATDSRAWARASYVDEGQIVPWAKATAVAFPLIGVASAFVNLATSATWAAYFHSVHVAFEDVGNGIAAPQISQPPSWGYVLLPFIVAAEALFLVWQYRSATTARRLGFPARRSPGLGVGSYYIPVVQLWFPYQALRDCLPPGHGARRLVLRVWLLVIVTTALDASLLFALAEARPLGLVLLATAIVLEGLLAAWGYRMVDSITAAHRDALSSLLDERR